MTKIRIIHIVILVSIVCSWMWSALKEWHKDFNKSLQKFPEEINGFASAIQIKNLSRTISFDAVFDVTAVFCGLLLRQNSSRYAINLTFCLQVQDSVYTFDLIHYTCQMHWSLSMAAYCRKSFTMVSTKLNTLWPNYFHDLALIALNS